MKKLLIAAALMTALSANATNWIRIADGNDDVRLIMDADTFAPATADDGMPLIAAIFQYVKAGEPSGGLAYVTPISACKSGGGQLWARTFKDGVWTTNANYFWSADGLRLYDFAGGALCVMLKAKMEQNAPQKPASKSPAKEKGNV